MPPTLNRWLRRIGLLLALVGCVYVGYRVWRGAPGLHLRWPPADMVALALLCGTAGMAALACGWYALLRAAGGRPGFASAFRAYAISQPAKYLPGNVLHFAARHALGRADGGEHGPLLSAAALEAVSLIGTALLLGGTLASQGLLAHTGVSRWLPLLIGFGGLSIAAILLARYRGARCLAWFGAHLAAATGYFLASSCAFSLLGGAPYTAPDLVLPVVSIAWVAGFVVVGAPGGIGVREAVMLQLLAPDSSTALVGAVLAFRLTAIAADLCLYAAAWLPPRTPAQDAGT
ncbi:MAG: hypothetical protein OMOMHJEC_02017 [Xanthomonadales bacterium]|nr:hypothetical protein [Xanthomonadales bacterium]